MAETVDLVDNRLPVILCSEQFGVVAKDPGCNSGPGIEPTSDVWAVRRKYLLPPELASALNSEKSDLISICRSQAKPRGTSELQQNLVGSPPPPLFTFYSLFAAIRPN
jgi:hypothetical protein